MSALFLVQAAERGASTFSAKIENPALPEGIDHKAHEGLADKRQRRWPAPHELADLARKLGRTGEHGIVVGGDKDGIGVLAVDAVNHQSPILHVASGLLFGKLLKGERGTGGTEDAGHVVPKMFRKFTKDALSV